MVPFSSPAVLEVEGHVENAGSISEEYHFVQRAHFGLFGGSARSMLNLCALRMANKVAGRVLRNMKS
jgi:hypothetical protein